MTCRPVCEGFLPGLSLVTLLFRGPSSLAGGESIGVLFGPQPATAAGQPHFLFAVRSFLQLACDNSPQQQRQSHPDVSGGPCRPRLESGLRRRCDHKTASSCFASSEQSLPAVSVLWRPTPSITLQKRLAIPELAGMLGRDLVGQARQEPARQGPPLPCPDFSRLDPTNAPPKVLVLHRPPGELALQVLPTASTPYAANLVQGAILPILRRRPISAVDQIVRAASVRFVHLVSATLPVMDQHAAGTLDLSGLRSLVLDGSRIARCCVWACIAKCEWGGAETNSPGAAPSEMLFPPQSLEIPQGFSRNILQGSSLEVQPSAKRGRIEATIRQRAILVVKCGDSRITEP